MIFSGSWGPLFFIIKPEPFLILRASIFIDREINTKYNK